MGCEEYGVNTIGQKHQKYTQPKKIIWFPPDFTVKLHSTVRHPLKAVRDFDMNFDSELTTKTRQLASKCPGFPRLLESPGFFFLKIPGPGKSWKNILESHAFFLVVQVGNKQQ